MKKNNRLAQSRRHGGFGGLGPAKELPSPLIEIWNTINQWSFCQILECQATCTPIQDFLATVLDGLNMNEICRGG